MAERWDKAAEQAAGEVFGSPVQNVVRTLAFVLAVFVVATGGYVHAGWSLGDASYMVTLTIFSVGYGEVRPIDTNYLHALTMGTMILGCTGMIVLTGALVQLFAQFQLRNLLGIDRMQTQIAKLHGHSIICGYGRIGQQLAKELFAAKQSFIILERNPVKIASAEAAGYLCLAGDAADETSLRGAGIEHARVLASVLPDDATNVFITLSARSLNPDLEIIARGELPSTETKLIHAGANKVVLPTQIGAERIAEMILYPTTSRFVGESAQVRDLKRGLHEYGLEVEALTVPSDSAMVGETVGAAERMGNGAFFVVQIDRPGGQHHVHPAEDVKIEAEDMVVLVVRGSKVSAGAIFNAPKKKVRIGRSWI